MSLVYAHRGASGYASENTLEAFKLAMEMGADGFELDVHLSKDGELIVIHDEKVDRTTNGSGVVAEMTLEELKALDASNGIAEYQGVKIPTLGEVYDLVKDTNHLINVEIKTDQSVYPGIEKKCLELEKEKGMTGRIIYSSFNHYTVKTLKALAPDAKVGLLFGSCLYEPWKYAKEIRADYIHPCENSLYLSEDIVLQSVENGIGANVWTINDKELMKECLRQKGNIITNYPDIAVALRKDHTN